MSKPVPKRGPSKQRSPKKKKKTDSEGKAASPETEEQRTPTLCVFCDKDIPPEGEALFVEEEVGRIFCSEKCIVSYFEPEIEKLEDEYFKHLAANDLDANSREKFAHLRWKTLEAPNEVWVEKTVTGDYRYTLIGEYQRNTKPIWSICISLLLRGEPSFLYLSFVTTDEELVSNYRKGDPVNWEELRENQAGEEIAIRPGSEAAQENPEDPNAAEATDGLAEPWTEEETYRAQIKSERQEDDIPPEEFLLYQGCIDETLESPDEVWVVDREGESSKVYHFIRHYSEGTGYWYIIIARETEEEDQLEILDGFPTRDPDLTDKYRVGNLEMGGSDSQPGSRLVH